MSDPSIAVFLSYASQDAEAARRICESLRGAGVEVWFDQSELRGGDAWDAKIRKQIKECALFVPIISANTQARLEGYFRLEWHLAERRMQRMHEEAPFLLPVVIDAIAQDEAKVPARFMEVQWITARDETGLAALTERIGALLENAAVPAAAGPAPELDERRPRDRGHRAVSRRGRPAKWLVAAVVVALIPLAFWRPGLGSKPAAVAATPVAPAVNDKSIAVLPFENRSEEKANAFFTDGIHEDILTNLAHIAALRVVSRTSVMEYRGTTKKIRQIGQELGVAWLLEGSVQRSGNQVRVTGQLINARTDEYVWAKTYDRDLTDIFAIQSAVAQEIAAALQATLSPREKNLLQRPATVKPEAYELTLRAREIDRNGNDTRAEAEEQQKLLEQATALDPGFAGAWGALAAVHGQLRFNGFDTSAARLTQARTAFETAQRLDPESPLTIFTAGAYYYYALRDYSRAETQFERITREWPNDSLGYLMQGLVQRRQGKWVESLATLRRAAALDPRSPELARNLMISLRAMRRFDEAKVEQAKRVAILPESLRESFELARLDFMARGSTREVEELLAGPVAARAGAEVVAGYRKLWAATNGDLATAARLEREVPEKWGETLGNFRYTPAWSAAVLLLSGDVAAGRSLAASAVAERRMRLATEPENPAVWGNLGFAEAVLGHKAEALTAARRAIELLPESRDSLQGAVIRWMLVSTLAWTGEKDAACTELARLLTEPSHANVHELRAAAWLAPLKGDPRFEALMSDPKNNAPLF